MTLLPLATESISAHLEFFRNLRFQSTGVLVVIVSLGILAAVVALVARLLAPRGEAEAGSVASGEATGGAHPIPPEIRAVIAAAVHTSLRSPYRIQEIRPPVNPMLTAWSAEGRRQIFQSHSLRR